MSRTRPIELDAVIDYQEEVANFCRENAVDLNNAVYVSTGEFAYSTLPIVTVGLKICGAIVISFQEQNFLVHNCTFSAEHLVRMVRNHVSSDALTSNEIKLHIYLGKLCSVSTYLEVLNELGLLVANIDFNLLKNAMREYVDFTIAIIQRFNLARQPHVLAVQLLEFSQDEEYQWAKAIIEATTIADVPSSMIVSALRLLDTPKNKSQIFACTNGIFTVADDNVVINSMEVKQLSPIKTLSASSTPSLRR